nr:MAG TPA: hypothetical protein [Caudoviricetes sp.]DAK68025.1 MAG TPA: hypothetical protein [Caudoviricetes sp.]
MVLDRLCGERRVLWHTPFFCPFTINVQEIILS